MATTASTWTHPLLIYDGDTDQLITAVLRPGTVHASRGVVAVLRRLVAAIRARWPDVHIELRADSGFAVPALYDYCERAGLDYTIGLPPNGLPMGGCKRWPPRSSSRPSSSMHRRATSCGWPARARRRPIPGPIRAGSSTKLRRSRKEPTPVSW